MAGTRQSLEVLQGKGKKHLSKAEIAQRQGQEVKLPAPKKIGVPKWLPEHLKGDFRALAKEVLQADMGAANLDRDTLGRYLVAQDQYSAACRLVRDALDREDAEDVNAWSKTQDTCFKQARACANDMGLTITSRCRLVLPASSTAEEENPYEKMMRQREERQHRA